MAYKGSSTQRSRIMGLSQAGNKSASDVRLDNFIENNRDLKNQSPSIDSILQDMPKKNADFVRRQLEKTGGKRLNEAAKSMLSFYADERPEYSRQLNRLRTSSPEMMDAYARKFPIQNFAMQAGPMAFGAMTGIPVAALQAGFDNTRKGAGLGLDSLKRGGEFLVKGIDKGLSAVEGGLDRLSGDTGKMITDTGEIIKNTGTDVKENIFGTGDDQNLFSQTEDNFLGLSDAEYAEYQRNKLNQLSQRDNRINPLAEMLALNTSTDTPGIERIFKLPGDFKGDFNNQYFTGVPDRSLKDNYLVNNPNLQSLVGMNLNQGGLASLNNRDYGMLMSASNFGF